MIDNWFLCVVGWWVHDSRLVRMFLARANVLLNRVQHKTETCHSLVTHFKAEKKKFSNATNKKKETQKKRIQTILFIQRILLDDLNE